MSTPLKVTPLNAVHLEMGARLVDFAGWSMPLHYGSQLDEHKRVRSDAGMFDVSHMLAIDVNGAGARDFLRAALANDVARLRAGGALYSCMLAEDGGILDDLIVYAEAGDRFRLVVNAGTADKDLAWLESQASLQSADINVEPRRDLAMIAVQGPSARPKAWAAWPESRSVTENLKSFEAARVGDDSLVARTGYTGEDGFEVMLPAARAEALWRALARAGVAPTGLAARDTLRLEAGMSLYGQDMDERVTPFECGLGWTVERRSAREFVGRRALETRAPRFSSTGLVLEERGIMRSHQRVFTDAGEGEITSGGFSPTMNRSIALARVPPGTQPDSRVEVEVREKRLEARIVKPPFVRNGKILVSGKR